MDSRTPPSQTTRPPNHTTVPGPDPNTCDCKAAPPGKVVALLCVFLKTVRHFFPELPGWLDQLPDTRFQPMVVYHRRFLCWWGLLLFGLGLGSRRSADNDLRDLELAILHNLNRLAGTQQDCLLVTKTLDHFIGHAGSPAFAKLLHQHTQRLIRMWRTA